jgi:uncharacterized protein YndB with AHSA1/START domain
MIQEQTLQKSISINAPVSKVWDALTSPHLMKQWMLDSEIDVISDWKTGSPIVIRMELNRKKYESKGVILQFEPEKVFSYNCWSKISRLPDKPENYSVIEFRLMPIENGTKLTFTQKNFPAEAAYEHSNFYWNSALETLRKIIENPNYESE